MSVKKSWFVGLIISLIIGLAIGFEITKLSSLFKGIIVVIIYTIPVSCFWMILIHSISNKIYKDKALKHRLPMTIFALITVYTLPISLMDTLWNINLLSVNIQIVLLVLGIFSFIAVYCIPLLTNNKENIDFDSYQEYCDDCPYTDCMFRNKRALLKELKFDHRKLRCQKEVDEYIKKSIGNNTK